MPLYTIIILGGNVRLVVNGVYLLVELDETGLAIVFTNTLPSSNELVLGLICA
jgi:hypothetical protein